MSLARRLFVVSGLSAGLVLIPAIAQAHENQVIRFGSFFGGVAHPVLGLDHLLAMLSVGVVSALIGGGAIWKIPATFVSAMAVGGLAGVLGLNPGSVLIEGAIAISVLLLGLVIALDRRVNVKATMAAVFFFGSFHGVAHGTEVPDIAEPVVYSLGFLTGTAFIHLFGVLIGDIARRYRYGRIALRVPGAAMSGVGVLFLVGAL